jgi:hypothetical protein
MTDWFAGDVAERYDESTAGKLVEPVVDFLEPFAGGGSSSRSAREDRRAALEQGIRCRHRPLAGHGRAAAADGEIPVEIGGMTTTRVDGTFSLAYIVFNSSTTSRRRTDRSPCSRTPRLISSRRSLRHVRSASRTGSGSGCST